MLHSRPGDEILENGGYHQIMTTAAVLSKHLETVEPSALDGRMPVLLVHGIGPGQDKYYNWVRAIKHLHGSKAFNRRFKIYLFAYNPALSGQEGGRLLAQTLRRLLECEPSVAQTGYVAMTNSLGGLIFLYALADEPVGHLCHRMISVGALYHGTPIADRDFARTFYATVEREGLLRFPLRWALPVADRVAIRMYPHYRELYCWQNYDLPAGYLPDDYQVPPCPRPVVPPEFQQKVRPYASFFGAGEADRQFLLGFLGFRRKLPEEVFHWRDLYFKKGALSLVNRHFLSRREICPGGCEGRFPPMLLFNDGISSIASNLWMGRFVDLETCNRRPDAVWQALLHMKGLHQGRLFAGVDHRDWMEGVTRTESSGVYDLLHPDLPSRSIFDWYLFDLLSIEAGIGAGSPDLPVSASFGPRP